MDMTTAELFAIRLALQERNQQAQLRLRGALPRLCEPVLVQRSRQPPPSQLRRPAPQRPRGLQGLAAFVERLRPKEGYLDLTA